MLCGKRIICFSSIDWDFIWQGHQEIMKMLAANGNQVLFVENTGVRRPTLRDIPRLRQRVWNWWRGTNGFRQQQDKLFIYSPLILPFPYSRVARWINRALLLRALKRWIRAARFYRPIIWTFLPTPLVRDVVRELDPELQVYYCIDDLASSSLAARRISRSEAQVFREADLVFVTSDKLRERAARYSNRVHLFPFGVSYGEFERIRNSPDEIPVDLKNLPRPVVGYVGGIHQWVDQELLAAVARRMPEVSFVMIGPLQTDVAELVRCPNVHLFEHRSHDAVPRYIKGFDVGIIPYRLTEYTANVYPTKLNEYLAMGIPVVATALPEIERFNSEQGEVVVASSADAFAEAILEAVGRISPADAMRRIEIARQNSWETRIGRMSELIEEALEVHQAAEERGEESLRRLYRRARRQIIRTVAGVVATYVLLFYTPFAWLVAEPLRVLEPSRRVDAVVVFAGGVGESGKAGGGYQERVKHAVDFYHEGKAARLIFSSGYAFAFREVEMMKDLAVSLGVAPSAIILEAQAASTFQNVAFVRDILRRERWREIMLVSSPYHMRRALLTWRKIAPDVRVISTPVPYSQFYAHGWGADLEQIKGILHEYAAIVYYWWRGWI
jgi:uncharacterized SAM-binding protein YcdF (DUF218 family)/glycosyltransferase involved in cell wall biosynthesis